TDAIETSDFPSSFIGTGLRSATSDSEKKSRMISAFDDEGASKPIRTSDTTAKGSATLAVAATYTNSRLGTPKMVDTNVSLRGRRWTMKMGPACVVPAHQPQGFRKGLVPAPIRARADHECQESRQSNCRPHDV